MTDSETDDLEGLRRVTIDPNMKDTVLAILVEPTIKTWGDTGSFPSTNRGRIEPIVLKAVTEILQAQHNQMKDGAKPKMTHAPVLEGIIEYAPILAEIMWLLI